MEEKAIVVGSALDDLRAFPELVKRRAGFELGQVQAGDEPSDFKPMQTVGPGVYEVRIREEGQAVRVFYVAKFEEAIYVLHAFEKKTRRTSKKDIQGRRRYKEVIAARQPSTRK